MSELFDKEAVRDWTELEVANGKVMEYLEGRLPGVSPHALIGEDIPGEWPWNDPPWSSPPLPVLLHPDVRIKALAVVAAGTRRRTWVGRVYVGPAAIVSHDCRVDDGAFIGARSMLGGFVEIGRNAKVGLGALVRPFRQIGEYGYLGMGSVLLRDIPPGEVWFGNPARYHGRRCAVCGQIEAGRLCYKIHGR